VGYFVWEKRKKKKSCSTLEMKKEKNCYGNLGLGMATNTSRGVAFRRLAFSVDTRLLKLGIIPID
jgi:hypothetical protein